MAAACFGLSRSDHASARRLDPPILGKKPLQFQQFALALPEIETPPFFLIAPTVTTHPHLPAKDSLAHTFSLLPPSPERSRPFRTAAISSSSAGTRARSVRRLCSQAQAKIRAHPNWWVLGTR